MKCGYLDLDYSCMKDGKHCRYVQSSCPRLKAEQRGMKQLREETRKP
jgi:hypothetical protein